MRALGSNNTLATDERIVSMQLEKYEAVTDYTELVQSKLQAELELTQATEMRLSIIDKNGLLLKTYNQKAEKGINRYQLDFADLSLGQYYVVLVADDVYRRFCVAKTQ